VRWQAILIVGLVIAVTGAACVVLTQPAPEAQTRVQELAGKVQAGIQRWIAEGRDPSPATTLVGQIDPLIKAGKLAEAEALLNRALVILDSEKGVVSVPRFEPARIGQAPFISTAKSVKLSRIPSTADLIFHRDGYLFTMDREGGQVTQITFGTQRSYEHAAVSYGQRFVVANEHPPQQPGSSIIWLYDLENGREAQLLPQFYFAGDGGIAWDRLGFVYFVAKAQKADRSINVYRIKYDGTGLARLTDTPLEAHDVGVSEDGAMITYLVLVPEPALNSAHTEVWVSMSDGSKPRMVYKAGLVFKGSAHDPELSPDNKSVAFSMVNSTVRPNYQSLAWANTAHDIWRINLDSSGLTRVTKPGPISIIPNWTDGLIVYTEISERDGYHGAAVVGANDAAQTTPKRIRAGANSSKWIPK
jgi:Tol biopolymer transport system component